MNASLQARLEKLETVATPPGRLIAVTAMSDIPPDLDASTIVVATGVPRAPRDHDA